jgi:hypothetical protein
MIIKRIIPGFVIQTLTTDSEYPIGQEFIASSDGIKYETPHGKELFREKIGWYMGEEPNLSLRMVQPNPRGVDSGEKI